MKILRLNELLLLSFTAVLGLFFIRNYLIMVTKVLKSIFVEIDMDHIYK